MGEEIAQRRDYSEDTAREVDGEIHDILEQAYDQALEILNEHREQLDHLAEKLIEHEEIPGERVVELVTESKKSS